MSSILITAIGSFSADIVIKTLKEMGNYVVGCDIYPEEWIVDAMNVDQFYQAPYASDIDNYMTFIFSVCEEKNIQFLIPLTDAEVDVLNEYREEIEKRNIILCISGKECIKLCRNKLSLFEYLNDFGIKGLISTKYLNESDIYSLQYPVVMKPYDGRSSQGLHCVYSLEEAEKLVKTIDMSKYIIQPMIQGDIITVDVVRDMNYHVQAAVCRKELLRTLNGAGLSVHVFRDENLEQEAMHIADCLGVQGCVNFEFIQTKDHELFFLECNPRFSGGVEFSCLAGYDCVRNHLRCFQRECIDRNMKLQEMYIARKYEEYITHICKEEERI